MRILSPTASAALGDDAAYLAQTGGRRRIASATLITTLVDFGDMGEWSVLRAAGSNAFDRYLDGKGYRGPRPDQAVFGGARQ
jgi:hypothetical protein